MFYMYLSGRYGKLYDDYLESHYTLKEYFGDMAVERCGRAVCSIIVALHDREECLLGLIVRTI